jgi:phosphatidylglycerophosphate synthase
VTLVVIGFFADIFDGIIARKINVSNEQLRITDSVVDRIFWLCVLSACYLLFPVYISTNFWLLGIVLLGDLSVYIVSLIRFKKIPSPHNLLTKLWGILIAISIIEILITGHAVSYNIMIVVGIISRVDSLLIYLFLRNWDHDIPSSYHAYQLRQGRKIRRHKLFNG